VRTSSYRAVAESRRGRSSSVAMRHGWLRPAASSSRAVGRDAGVPLSACPHLALPLPGQPIDQHVTRIIPNRDASRPPACPHRLRDQRLGVSPATVPCHLRPGEAGRRDPSRLPDHPFGTTYVNLSIHTALVTLFTSVRGDGVVGAARHRPRHCHLRRSRHRARPAAYDRDRKTWVPVASAGWTHEEFAIYVWRSVREGGDTKTKKSRRTLKLPQRCVWALADLWERQAVARRAAGDEWQNNDLVFATRTGTALDAHNVRRDFRKIIVSAGLVGAEWTP
jgi:hypothetical protein